MERNKIEIYLHLVWGTWDRQPVLTSELERPVHRSIEQEAKRLGCKVLALNGTEDHVHILVTLPTTLCVADLLKQLKGVSSHFVNDTLRPNFLFRWQGGYGAFSVSRRALQAVIDYINHQKEHHLANTLYDAYEPPSRPNTHNV